MRIDELMYRVKLDEESREMISKIKIDRSWTRSMADSMIIMTKDENSSVIDSWFRKNRGKQAGLIAHSIGSTKDYIVLRVMTDVPASKGKYILLGIKNDFKRKDINIDEISNWKIISPGLLTGTIESIQTNKQIKIKK